MLYAMKFTAPYYIIQPSTDDTVKIVPPNAATNFQLTCTLNVEIPVGMTVTWLHNGNLIWTITNQNYVSTNILRLIGISEVGVYQCAFNYTTGYIVRRNITVLGMCSIIHSYSHIAIASYKCHRHLSHKYNAKVINLLFFYLATTANSI